MELNRNHYLTAGLVILGLGLQFRYVESLTLSPEATKFIEEKIQGPETAATANPFSFFPIQTPLSRKVVKPPRWIGWAFLSTGGVLVLHSLAMKKPGGGP